MMGRLSHGRLRSRPHVWRQRQITPNEREQPIRHPQPHTSIIKILILFNPLIAKR
jgi:hypothetical protein